MTSAIASSLSDAQLQEHNPGGHGYSSGIPVRRTEANDTRGIRSYLHLGARPLTDDIIKKAKTTGRP
jgi:hypothetical protein